MAIIEDSKNLYIHSERSLVSTIGVKDLVIVDTPDALLVADKSRSQDVSTIVKRLKESGRKEQEQHLRNYRPWGFFETLSIAPHTKDWIAWNDLKNRRSLVHFGAFDESPN